jgi:multidrug efflux pump subunit AcrA (membrane-fusion protein)
MKNLIYLTLIISLLSCQRTNEKAQKIEETEFPVSVSSPKYMPIEYKEIYTAIISADPLTNVFPDVPGKFISYLVSEGQYVNKNQAIAKISRETPGLEFQDYIVQAPTSGKIHLLNINSGQIVSPITPIAQIYGNPIAIIKLPSIHYNKVKLGDKVKLISEEFKMEEDAIIYYKSQIIDPQSQTFEIRCKVYKFPIGAFAKAVITLDKKDKALLVPTKAILGLDKKYVFILDGNKVYKKVIQIGISNEDWTEVREGLNSSDKIVIEGQGVLSDGSKVRVVKYD